MMNKNGILLAGKTMMKLMVLMVLMGLGVSNGFAVLPTGEKNTLLALWSYTGGSSWENKWNILPDWKFGDPCEQNWYGVTCNADNTHVTEINMNFNNLTGSIPTSLGNLGNLTSLDLGDNKLTGSIPASLGNLGNLIIFLIHHNKFYGPIDIDLPSKLYTVRMDHNYFTNIDGLSTFLEDIPLDLEQNCIRDFDPVSHLSRLTGKNNQLGDHFNGACSDWDSDGIPAGADPDDKGTIKPIRTHQTIDVKTLLMLQTANQPKLETTFQIP